jgi:hypothetical protein
MLIPVADRGAANEASIFMHGYSHKLLVINFFIQVA